MAFIKKLLIFSLLFLTFVQCQPGNQPENKYRPAIFALTTTDIDRSMDWYTQHLYFTRDTIMHFPDYGISVGMMHQGGFFLELVEFADGISRDSSLLPQGYFEIDGFFKIGFQAKDIAALYENMAANEEIKMVAPLGDLSPPADNFPWPDQFFLIEDPEGNYVQFFFIERRTGRTSGNAQSISHGHQLS
ncbi:MAG: VOC family protein [Roseivirga sp.]|nr:VOC family protein [Roseivirga sp.]